MKRETKQKMNGVIYYLLTSFTAKRKKNKAMKSTKHNAVKADYHWLAIPICLAFKTVHYSAQHFLKFSSNNITIAAVIGNNYKFGISSSKIKTTTNTAAASAHREDGVWAWPKQLVMPRPLPKLLEMVEGTPPPTTTTKNTNVIMIVFCCLILIFFW